MGSSLFPDYNLEKTPYMKLRYWQIYKAINKSTGESLSAFIFEKKNLEKKTEEEKNTILLLLKKEPESLIKGKNKHKNFLKVIEPLAEDSYSIGFITEYVNYNLKDWIKEYKPNMLEIKYIIYQIISVVITLHSEFQISHNNLNIENIFIKGNSNFIKISGFMLSSPLMKGNNYINNITQQQIEAYCDLKYCSPELILNNDINNNSDNFIIGLICYYLLNKYDNSDLFVLLDNNCESYKHNYKNINIDKKINKIFNDDNTKDFLKNLLNNNPDKRKSLSLMLNSKFFIESEDNNKLIPLCLLSRMESLELSKNYELLKKLPNILNLYSTKEKEFLVLPNLLYFLKKENLINPIIPSIFLVCEQSKQEINFSQKIWPDFKLLFNMKKLPAAALYFILKKISFLIKNLEKEEFNNYCIPLICKALDCGVQKIQEVILEEMPNILKDLDPNEFKKSIYNKLINIIIQTKNNKLKAIIMNFLLYLCDYLDSYFINNKFLEDIEKIIKNETTLSTCKNSLILYEKVKSKVNDKSVRSKIIPSLLLMMCNGEISEELFNKGEKIIHDYITKIKEKRKSQFVNDIENNNENNNSDEIKNNNNANNNNNIGVNSPLSISRTKSTISSLVEYNSSEDSNLELNDKIKKIKNLNSISEKKIESKNINNNNKNNGNNIFDNLLNDLVFEDKNSENISFDSESIGKAQNNQNNQNKNIVKLPDKKEFLSSMELKKIEEKKKQAEKKEKEKEKEKINNNNNMNLWEEIESDDENNDVINDFIKKKKKSGNINNKEKEKEKNNDKENNKTEKIKSNKKWDEDEDEEGNIDENKINNEINNNDINEINNQIEKNDSENIFNDNKNNIKDNLNINKKEENSGQKKIKKKKKKKKKEKEKEKEKQSIFNKEEKKIEEKKENEQNIDDDTNKKNIVNINLDFLLAED